MRTPRHVEVEPGTSAEELGLAAIDDLLDRGDLGDWAPLLGAIRSNPWGAVADRVLRVVSNHRMYGTTPLLQGYVERMREATEPPVGPGLRALREARGITQVELAGRLGMSQPEVSRLEARADVRVSTARAYVRALGGRLSLAAAFGDEAEAPFA